MNAGPLPRHWLLRALELETGTDRGSDRLAREAVQAFREAAAEAWSPEADAGETRAKLDLYAQRLRNAQPSAAPLARSMDRCVAALAEERDAALVRLDALVAETDAGLDALAGAADPLFRPGARPLTHGHHETVEALLRHFADRLENVTVCEARPRNEGVRLAAALADLALPVRLITEGALDLFLPECDLAIVGAERVLPNGDVVARTGTAVVARLCAAHAVPFYVAAPRSRWIGERDELARFGRERRSPTEVLPETVRGVQVINILDDLTPAALVTGYLTEDGLVGRPGADAPQVGAASA